MQAFLALFFLGLVQGLTEFLPISSSGHLVLFSKILGVEESLFVSIILHVATLFSILVVLRKEVWQIVRHPFSKQSLQIVWATIPTCLIVLILMPIVKKSFSGVGLPICFFVSAIILYVAEVLSKKHQSKPFDTKCAIVMGIAQGLATFPGVSRSGTTISAGLMHGRDKKDVAKFSFLMSIPIIILSLFMEIFEISQGAEKISVKAFPMVVAFLTAFLSGVFALKFMIKLTEKSNLKWFSLYLVVISIISLFLI